MPNDKIKRRISLFCTVLITWCLMAPPVHASEKTQKKVLVLNSYHWGYRGSDDMVEGFRQVLLRDRPDTDMQIEYLDSKHFSGKEFDARVLDQLRFKYQKRHFDLIFSTDDYAFDILEKYRDSIFSGTPVIFCGTNSFDRRRLIGRRSFNGIDERPSFTETLQLIFRLHPHTRDIVVVHDASITGELNAAEFRAQATAIPKGVRCTYLAGEGWEELSGHLKRLKPGSVVIYFASFVAEKGGERLSTNEALQRLAALTPVPIYGGWEFSLGKGIVGGRLLNLREHGAVAGKMALRILNGASPASLRDFSPSPNQYMFDYTQMSRFGIEVDDLPAGSVIINEPPGFLQTYRVPLLAAVYGTLLLALLAIFMKLLKSRRELSASLQEQRQMSHSLAESEARFRTVVEAMPDIVYRWTTRRGGIYYSCHVTDILGYTPEELYAQPMLWRESIHPEDAPRVGVAVATFMQGEPFDLIYRIKDRSGNWRWFHDRSISMKEEGDEVVVEGIAADITRRRAEEEVLRLSEEKFVKVFNTSPDAISLTRRTDGLFLEINPVFTRILGFTMADLAGKTSDEVALWCDPEARNEILAAIEEHGEVVNREITFRHKDGSLLATLFSARPIEVHGMHCLLSTIRDISDRKVLEERLRQSLKMESIGRLAGGVAHDFNNKLTVILAYAEMCMLEVAKEQRLWRYLSEIFKAAEHSRDLTAQLLAFSRQQLISPKSVNLNTLVKENRRTLPRLIGEDIILSYTLPKDLWNVKMDPTQIDQIIMNLAINARDAMPNGGSLTIATANTVIDQAYCQENMDAIPGEYVQLSVSDTGHGMDQVTLRHLFEPFFTTKEVGKGTGLGLATVYGIITQNGGFIDVSSVPGEGTAFRIHLPRHHAVDLPASAASDSPVTGSGSVLLVEDDETVRATTMEMLKRIGYQVQAPATPEAAIELCGDPSLHFDLVLTDVVMPGMSGKEMSDSIRRMRPGIKVLFMSGYSSEVISRKGVLEEGVHLVQKPFDVSTLNSTIQQILEHGRQKEPKQKQYLFS